MAISALVLKASADRSLSVSFTSAGAADTLTYAALSTLLGSADSTIKSFLDATAGTVDLTLAALGSNGCDLALASSVVGSVIQVSADKTFAEFIEHVPASALSDSGLKRHYKGPETLHTIRQLQRRSEDSLESLLKE